MGRWEFTGWRRDGYRARDGYWVRMTQRMSRLVPWPLSGEDSTVSPSRIASRMTAQHSGIRWLRPGQPSTSRFKSPGRTPIDRLRKARCGFLESLLSIGRGRIFLIVDMSDLWRREYSGRPLDSARCLGILFGPVGRIQIRQVCRMLFCIERLCRIADNVLQIGESDFHHPAVVRQ